MIRTFTFYCSALQFFGSALQCVTVRCSVLQRLYVVVCLSVQCAKNDVLMRGFNVPFEPSNSTSFLVPNQIIYYCIHFCDILRFKHNTPIPPTR